MTQSHPRPRSSAPRQVRSVLATLLALGFLGCRPGSPAPADAKATNAPASAAVTVRVEPASRRAVPRFLHVTGQLAGYQDAVIAADTTGRVVETPVERGTRIDKGGVLARIDDRQPTLSLREAEASLALAKARLALARSDVERNAPLVQTRAVAEADFRRLEAEQAVRESEFAAGTVRADIARKNLADSTVRAPFAGVVAERFIQPGEYVRPDTRIARVVDTTRLRLILNVSEPDAGRLRTGQTVEFQTAAHPGRNFTGEVRFISAAIREAARDLQVEVEVANPDEALRPGFFAEARIRTGEQEAITIPSAALHSSGPRRSVFIVERDLLVERLVDAGESGEGWVEIRQGVAAGEPVVISAEGRLADGAPARVPQP